MRTLSVCGLKFIGARRRVSGFSPSLRMIFFFMTTFIAQYHILRHAKLCLFFPFTLRRTKVFVFYYVKCSLLVFLPRNETKRVWWPGCVYECVMCEIRFPRDLSPVPDSVQDLIECTARGEIS